MGFEVENGVLKKYTEEPGVTEFTIPSYVKEIGKNAFAQCRHLTEVVIPQSVIRIGEGAFKSCYSLRRMILPEGLTEIQNHTFAWCEELEEVYLPEYVRCIGYSAFDGCKSLKAVQLPKRLEKMSDDAFEDCKSLESLVIPRGVTKIGTAACCAVKEIRVSKQNPFYTSVDGVLYDKTVTRLLQCPTGRQQLIVPDSIRVIPSRAVLDCRELVFVTLPARLEKIGSWAFSHCDKLETITIPPGVSEIGGNPFMSCEALADIRVASGNRHFAAEGGFLLDKERTQILHFPLGQKKVTIPDTVTHFPTHLSAGMCDTVAYRGLTFTCKPNRMRFLLEAVINNEFTYFASDLPPEVQYDVLCKLWQMASRQKDVAARIQESLIPIFCWLIDRNDLTAAEKLLSMGHFDFRAQFERLALYANKKGLFDFELLLLNYKNENGGYDNTNVFRL